MRSLQTLGLIEVIGMVAAIQAADICAKAADIEIIGYEKINKGLVTVKIQGHVGAVKAAIEAARIGIFQMNKVISTLMIPRPDETITSMIMSRDTIGIHNQPLESSETVIIPDHNERTVECSAIEIEQQLSNFTSCLDDVKSETYQVEFDSVVVEGKTQCEGQETQPKQDIEANKDDGQERNQELSVNQKQSIPIITKKDDDYSSQQVEQKNSSLPETDTSNVLKNHATSNSAGDGKMKDKKCNLCHDPKCPREKGQPNKLCLYYEKK